jgi:hypothetical protein
VVLYILSSLAYWIFFRRVERRRHDGPGWHVPETPTQSLPPC